MSFESVVESFANGIARGSLAFSEWTMRLARRRETKRKNRPDVLEALDKAYDKVHDERMKLSRRRKPGDVPAGTNVPASTVPASTAPASTAPASTAPATNAAFAGSGQPEGATGDVPAPRAPSTTPEPAPAAADEGEPGAASE